jgi:hypothetical protein
MLAVAAVRDGVDASPAACSAEEVPAIPLGVNRTNLGRVKNFKPILDSIKNNKVRFIRLTLDPPFEKSEESIAYASALGLDILLNVPLWWDEFVQEGAQPRSGIPDLNFFRINKLSQLDLAKYENALRLVVQNIENLGGRVSAFEIGNEINWSAFNGDLPLSSPGQILDGEYVDRTAIELGFRKYSFAIDATRQVLKSSKYHTEAKIVTGGLVEGSHRPDVGTVLSLPYVMNLFEKYGIVAKADAMGLHFYPGISKTANADHAFSDILDTLKQLTKYCEPARPCWITEWGFRSTSAGCLVDDSSRLAEAKLFKKAIDCLSTHKVEMSYLFDWDKSSDYSVYRCDRLLEGGKVLN